jgi:hypothetical protein
MRAVSRTGPSRQDRITERIRHYENDEARGIIANIDPEEDENVVQ